MTNKLFYKGYSTEIHFSAVDKVVYGKIENITDLVNFESDSAKEIEAEFHKAVDDYLDFKQVNESKADFHISKKLDRLAYKCVKIRFFYDDNVYKGILYPAEKFSSVYETPYVIASEENHVGFYASQVRTIRRVILHG